MDNHGHGHARGRDPAGGNRSLPTVVAAIVLVTILVLYMVTYQVRFTEVAVIKTFGRAGPEDVINGATSAGLYWKWPWPIQRVYRYDARTRVFETVTDETQTRDKKNLIATTFVGWRIVDPLEFHVKLGDVENGEERLKSIIRSTRKEVIGKYYFSQFVSTDPEELKYRQIENDMLVVVQREVDEKKYGVKIELLGLKRLTLPETVTESVFEAMKKERQALAEQYRAEGEANARDIKAKANAIAQTIMGYAESRAQEIRAEGIRRAAQHYAVLNEDPEFAIFLDSLKSLVEILKDRATVVLDWQNPPFDLLRGNLPTPAAVPKTPGSSNPSAAATRPADDAGLAPTETATLVPPNADAGLQR